MKYLKDLGFSHFSKKEHRKMHKFLCVCGKIKIIQLRYVLGGITKSCGCLTHEITAQSVRTHGLRSNPLYSVHNGMMRRCHDPKDKEFKNYGKRGITVCKKWHNIKNFVSEMESSYSKGLLIERVDNSKGYSKKNCRWATPAEQSRNKRSNIKYKGECARDAAKRLGGCNSLVIMRIWRNKWSLEKAFTTPVTNKK